MSEEGDSWFKAAFGVDLGQAASKLKEVAGDVIAEAKGIEAQVGGAVQGAFNQVTGAAAGLVQKATGGAPAAPKASGGGAAGGGTGSFPLGGSVGRGGKNAANDVRAVQGALGIAADGQCGNQTIAAIEAFQRSIGQARPDGRVDAGGSTERALAGGARPAATSSSPPATPGNDDSAGGLAGIAAEAGGLLQGAESSVQASLQSAQDSVFTGLGVAPETAEQIKAAEQAIADFDRGRQAGRASGSAGLIDMLPPVQLAKAGVRIAEADDGEAEALKIADEKRATLAAIGKFGVDPAGSGAAIGESLGKSAVKARQEGRTAEFLGNLVGQGDVIAATVAVGGAGAGLEAGGAEGAAAGVEAGGARGAVTGVEEGGIVVRTAEGADAAAPTSRAPRFGEPIPPEAQAKGPPTEVDPVNPKAEPSSPKPNAAQTPEQARQNLIDAVAKQKAAEQASREATEEFVRFRANKPNPARGVPGDPSKFDPVVSEALEDQMLRAQQANAEAINELEAARQAARDAAGRAKGARGGGGFPPPR